MGKYTKLPQYAPIEQKLSSYTVTKDGCWEYNGCTNNYGYCLIMVDGKLQYAHRLSWEYHNKRKIPKGLTIDHICFNRKCINPEHLRLFKAKDNSARIRARLKTHCDKHNCKRKIIHCWSDNGKKMMRRTVCPECVRERSRKYKQKLRIRA